VRASAAALIALVVALSAGRCDAVSAQTGAADPCDIRTAERVVAIGDVHGAYQPFVQILRAAQLLDARDRWIGGRAILIQTGDVLDRGPDSRRVLDLLRRLERDASRQGGRAITLLGNHEVMRMIGDWRYVSAGEYAAFRNGGSEELREQAYVLLERDAEQQARAAGRAHDAAAFRKQFLAEVPLGWLEMRQAFGPRGDYGRWLRGRPAVVRVNDMVFVHGGLTAATAALGCAGINEAVRRDVMMDAPLDAALKLFPSSESGPLWDRSLVDAAGEAMLEGILAAVGARAIVVGHTVAQSFQITPRFNSRVMQIDTGMLGGEHYPGGLPSALEIRGDTMTAIYLDRREALNRRP
jgi:hypothetical protein